MKYFFIYLGLTILSALLSLVGALFFGAILMLVWNFAICALFPSLLAMSYGVAILLAWGISIIGTLLKGVEIKHNM